MHKQLLLSLLLCGFTAVATGQSTVGDATGTVEGSAAKAGFTDGAGKNGTGTVQINGRSYQADEILPAGDNKAYVDRLKQINGARNLQGLKSAYDELSPQIDKDPSSWAEATRTSTVVPKDMHRVQDEVRNDNSFWEHSLQKLSDGGARETLGDMLTECKTTTVVTPGSKEHTYTEERYCDTINIPAENGNKDVCERQAEYTETPTSDRKQKVSQLFVTDEGNGTVCKRETRAENYRDTLSGTITSTIDLTAETGGLSCRREIIPESITTQVTGEKSVALPIDQQIPANLCSREVYSELREAHTWNSMDATLNVNNEVGGLACTRRRTLYRQDNTVTKTYTATMTIPKGTMGWLQIWMPGPSEPASAQPIFVSARKIGGAWGPGSFGPGDGSMFNSVAISWIDTGWSLMGNISGEYLCRSGSCVSTYEITYQVRAVSNVWGIAESGNCWDGGTAQCPTQWGCTQAAPTTIDGIWVSDAEAAQLGALYPGAGSTCVNANLTRVCGGAATTSNSVNISSKLASGTTSISEFRVEVLNPQSGITVQTTQVPSAANGWVANFNVVRTNFSYVPAAPQIRLHWISNVWTTFIGTRETGNCAAAGSPNCPTRWTCAANAPITVNGVTITAADAASRAPLFPGAASNCARASLDKVCSGTASMSSIISIADKLPEGTVSISNFQVQTLNPQSGVNVVLTQTPSRDNGWNAHFRVDRSNFSYQPVSPQIKMTWGATVTIISTKVTDTGNCSDPGSTACPTRWTCAANAPTTVNGIAVSVAMAQKHAPLFPGAINSCTTGHLNRVCDGSSALITSIYIGHLLSSDSTEITNFAWKVNNPQNGVTIELVEAPSLANGWLAKFRGTRNYAIATNPVKPSLTLNWNYLSELKVRTSIITTGDCSDPYGSIAAAASPAKLSAGAPQVMVAANDDGAEVEAAGLFERTAQAVLNGIIPTANANPMVIASMSAVAASSCPVRWYCTKTAPGTANGIYVYPADLQQRGELYPGENYTCLDAEYRRECEGTGSNQTVISIADQIPASVTTIANYGWQIVDPGAGVAVRQVQVPAYANGWKAIFETTRTDWNVDPKQPTVRLVWDQVGIPDWDVDVVDQGNCGQNGDEFCKTKWTCLETYPPDPPVVEEVVTSQFELTGSDTLNGTVNLTVDVRSYMGSLAAIHDFKVASLSGTVDVTIVVEPSLANAWKATVKLTTKGFEYQYVAGKGLQKFARGKVTFAFKKGARPPYVAPPYRSQSPGPLYPGDDGSCKRAEKTMNCSGMWEGEQCFIDEDGKRECVTQPPTGEVPNDCKRLEDDESCTEVREECSEGGMSSNGHCYTGTKVYACKVTVVGEDVEIDEETVCEGAQPAPCADGKCGTDDKGPVSVSKAGAELVTSQTILMDYQVDGAPGGSGGMAKAIPVEKGATVGSMIASVFEAALNGIIPTAAAQENKDDAFGVPLPFPVPDPDPPGNPDEVLGPGMAQEMLSKVKLFTGERESCKKMLGGLLDCCTKDPPDSQKQWWERYGNFARENGMADLGQFADEQNGDGTGVWDNYDASSDAMTLNQSFTSLAENINAGGNAGNGDPNATLEDYAKQFSNYSAGNIRPKLGWYCKDHEKDLAIKKNLGQCTYLGSYCQSESLLGVCIVKMHVSCCFNSTVSKSIRDHMAKDGRFGMGTAKRPQCGGIPLTQLINANMENFSTDEVEARMAAGGFTPDIGELSGLSGEEFDVAMFGSGNSLNDPNRKGLQQRTDERLDGMSDNIVDGYDAIDGAVNQRSSTANTDVADPESPGAITFNPGLYFVDQGQIANVKVNRNGGKGAVSVTLRTIPGGTAVSGTDFAAVNTTLTWGAGEVGTKSVGIQTTNRNRATAATIMIEISNATGGAIINPLNSATVEINKASE